LNSSVQVRQESQNETTCNGDLKLTAVFTTFGKVQILEKGQPVSLPEDKKVPIPPQARGPLSNRKKSRNSNNCGSPDPTQGNGPRCRICQAGHTFRVIARRVRARFALDANVCWPQIMCEGGNLLRRERNASQGVAVEIQVPVRHKKARYQRRSLSLHMPMNVAMRMCIGMHAYPHYEYVHGIFKGYVYILHV